MDAYARIVDLALSTHAIKPQVGKTTLLIWRNQAHFDEWSRLVEFSQDVRIVHVNSKLLRIDIKDNIDREKVIIVGIGFGVATNYSDTKLVYHIVINEMMLLKRTAFTWPAPSVSSLDSAIPSHSSSVSSLSE
jgi:hypothetical protein